MFNCFPFCPNLFRSPNDSGGAPVDSDSSADPAQDAASAAAPASAEPAAPAALDPQPAAAQMLTTAKIEAGSVKADEINAAATGQADQTRAALIDSELRAAAALAGVPRERLPYMLRMADRAGMDAEGADLSALAEAAVAQVLSDVPGLGGGGTGSPASPPRIPAPDPDKMSDKEYYSYIDKKN